MKNEIINKFETLAELLNMPTTSELSTEKGRKKGKDFYKNEFLIIDFASCYGGYVLMIVNKTTSQSYFDKMQRLPKKEFIAYLDGLIYGLSKK